MNGPEWAFSLTGSRITYTRESLGIWSIGQSRMLPDGTWTRESLANSTNGYKPIGSLFAGDAKPLVKYVLGTAANRKTEARWQELDNPAVGGPIAPGASIEAGRWSPGERAIFVSLLVNGIYQIARYGIDTAVLSPQTSDPLHKLLPFAIRSPDFNNEIIVTTIDTPDAALNYYSSIGVYQTIAGTSQRQAIKRIYSPDPSLGSVASAEPFVFNGHSYVSFSIGPIVPKGAVGAKLNGQIWIASLDPASNFVRRVSPIVPNAVFGDPEFFLAPQTALIYYTEIVNGRRLIHRSDSGLTTSFQP